MKNKTYQDGVLYNADCLDIMRTFSDNSIDFILADYPWNIGKKDYDQIKTDFFDWFEQIILEFKRILKPRRSVISEISFDWLKESLDVLNKHLYYKQPIIAYCTNGIGRRSYAGWSCYQLLLWHGKEGEKPPVIINKYRDLIPYTLISNKNQGWIYPNPKNIECYKTLIRMFTNENDIVLDPFMGSGTTALACREEKRRFIGVEINEDWWKIEQLRLESMIGNCEDNYKFF